MAAQMTRRDLFKVLGYGAVGALMLDPEKLLWVPGEKTIFLPSITVVEEPELIASIWQLTIRLNDMNEMAAMNGFLGTEEKLKRQRLHHGALGTLMIDGTKKFETEWEEVFRTDNTVTYETKV